MTLSAPYNFVPISDRVITAEDLGLPEGKPSQDDPTTGGLSGELELTLTAKTPLLVGGEQSGSEKRFFETPDGRAIPGASLRGMLRNVIEIASFARMWRVEDRRFGMRDLTGGARMDYGDRMSINHGDSTFEARSRGGWLTQTKSGLHLEEVAYARIEHDFLFDRNERNRVKKTVKDMEKAYRQATERTLCFEDEVETHHHRNGKKLIYRKAYPTHQEALDDPHVTRRGGLSKRQAFIVFSGMPNGHKHMEFAFPLPQGNFIDVPKEVWEKFLDVHENLEKPSDTWLHWREKLRNGARVPVFFLLKDDATETRSDTLDQIGLSMMFKLAGENKTHDMLPDAHKDDALIDLPTRMFGRVSKDHGSFRGRVSFGILTQSNEVGLKFEEGKKVVLSSPKPSYFPSYVRQRDLANATTIHRDAQYRSYMNWKHVDGRLAKRDTLRGWKRYPHPQNLVDPPNPPENTNERSASRLFPLAEGAAFSGKIRFHNLHPIELSALLWALEWGGCQDCFHSLGMGKPFGWGRVTLEVSDLTLSGEGKSKEDYKEQFPNAMEKCVPGGWRTSPQIKSLLAMARPEHRSNTIKQMPLKDFAKAKVRREVLPEIGFAPTELGLRYVQPGDLDKIKRTPRPEEQRAFEIKRQEQEREQALNSTSSDWSPQIGEEVYWEHGEPGEEFIVVELLENGDFMIQSSENPNPEQVDASECAPVRSGG